MVSCECASPGCEARRQGQAAGGAAYLPPWPNPCSAWPCSDSAETGGRGGGQCGSRKPSGSSPSGCLQMPLSPSLAPREGRSLWAGPTLGPQRPQQKGHHKKRNRNLHLMRKQDVSGADAGGGRFLRLPTASGWDSGSGQPGFSPFLLFLALRPRTSHLPSGPQFPLCDMGLLSPSPRVV